MCLQPREGMLKEKSKSRVAALYVVRAAVFWPGCTAGKAGLRGVTKVEGVKVHVHRISALYHKAGTGADGVISVEKRLKLSALTASHVMEGFPGSERNVNPWMVSTGCAEALMARRFNLTPLHLCSCAGRPCGRIAVATAACTSG